MTTLPRLRIDALCAVIAFVGAFACPSSAEPAAQVDSACTLLPVTVSLVPQVSTAHRYDRPVTSLSFNLLMGKHYALRGVEFGVIANVQESSTRGVQCAGIVNIAGGNVRGIQGAGIANIVGESVTGVQGATIVSIAGRDVLGAQSSAIGCISGGDVRGSQAAGIFTIAGRAVEGFQGSYIISIAGGGIGGAQMGGIMSISGSDVTGAQLSGIGSITGGTVEGLQAGGVFVVAPQVRGAQVGMFTTADSVFGLQVGFVNRSKRPEGYPIGLINLVEGVPFRVAVVGDESGATHLELKSGSRHTHGVISLGGRVFSEPQTQALGLGVGAHFEKPRFYVDVDAVTYGLFAADPGGEGSVSTLRGMVGVPVVPHVSALAGARMSFFISDEATGAAFAPWSLYKGTIRGNYVRVWPGLTAGLSVSF